MRIPEKTSRLKGLLLQELEKYSKRELAKRMGIPLSSLVNYIDTDTEPRASSLKKIAAYFNVPVSYFVEEEAGPAEGKRLEELKDDEREMLVLYREARMYGVAEDGKKFFRRLIEAVKEQDTALLFGRGERREGEAG